MRSGNLKYVADIRRDLVFDGFTASVYTMRGEDGRWRTGVSAKAAAVRVVQAPDDLDLGPEVD